MARPGWIWLKHLETTKKIHRKRWHCFVTFSYLGVASGYMNICIYIIWYNHNAIVIRAHDCQLLKWSRYLWFSYWGIFKTAVGRWLQGCILSNMRIANYHTVWEYIGGFHKCGYPYIIHFSRIVHFKPSNGNLILNQLLHFLEWLPSGLGHTARLEVAWESMAVGWKYQPATRERTQ